MTLRTTKLFTLTLVTSVLVLFSGTSRAEVFDTLEGTAQVRKFHDIPVSSVSISGDAAKAIFDSLIEAHTKFGRKGRVISVRESIVNDVKQTSVLTSEIACVKADE